MNTCYLNKELLSFSDINLLVFYNSFGRTDLLSYLLGKLVSLMRNAG